ncbi:hypothetical protein PUR49_10840 [Streptomyces sp. BE147]|uniref:hypothetical protein n=1 Tax=Streptomyces sp. BE147 TaxID=3002524 RepID=UPI002E79158F|nr:hypothetical protein [Streptomyces sp. BE147]MEE1736994.1 hypothetical protein [Streptomyces sp. BE147]
MTAQPGLDGLPYGAHLAALDVVEGIALCGSHRQGTADTMSDLDLWIFVRDTTPLSETYVLDRMLPADARQEQLFEGRDDTLASHLVLNLLTTEGILNLKVLHTRVLERFVQEARPNLDPQFLEDLENYVAMVPLHDPHGILTTHQDHLRDTHVTTAGEWLTPLLLQRYASLYWRSVYQGLLRIEPHAWRHLMGLLLALLASQDAVNGGGLPPPAKWLMSPRIRTANKSALTLLQDQVADASPADHRDVLAVYASLARVESAIWGPVHLPHGLWWHRVFSERLPNLARGSDNPRLEELLAALPAALQETQ